MPGDAARETPGALRDTRWRFGQSIPHTVLLVQLPVKNCGLSEERLPPQRIVHCQDGAASVGRHAVGTILGVTAENNGPTRHRDCLITTYARTHARAFLDQSALQESLPMPRIRAHIHQIPPRRSRTAAAAPADCGGPDRGVRRSLCARRQFEPRR